MVRTINFNKGEMLTKKDDKAGLWYLILDGSVIQSFGLTELVLEKDTVAGIHECDRVVCTYTAASDGKAAVFEAEDWEKLHILLNGNEKLRPLFLKAALKQHQQMLQLYIGLEEKARHFYSVIQSFYYEYQKLCSAYSLEECSFSGIGHFKPLEVRHKAEQWELQGISILTERYLEEYVSFMVRETDLSVGTVMECAARMRHIASGIAEVDGYLLFHEDFLFAESENDIFSLYFDLAVRAGAARQDLTEIHKRVKLISEYARKIKLYEESMIERRVEHYECCGFAPERKAKIRKRIGRN